MDQGTRRSLAAACAGIAVGAAAGTASADRYEATVTLRPSGGLARVEEGGADDASVVETASLAGSLSWGVRNWLDVGGELTAGTLAEASYRRAVLPVDGNPMTGSLRRASRAVQARGVATLRLGVGWVPTVQLSIGAGVRQRSAAILRGPSQQGDMDFVPDGAGASLTLDLVSGVRVGLERRLTSSWTVGAAVGVWYALGIGAPNVQAAEASITLARVWYPLW